MQPGEGQRVFRGYLRVVRKRPPDLGWQVESHLLSRAFLENSSRSAEAFSRLLPDMRESHQGSESKDGENGAESVSRVMLLRHLLRPPARCPDGRAARSPGPRRARSAAV